MGGVGSPGAEQPLIDAFNLDPRRRAAQQRRLLSGHGRAIGATAGAIRAVRKRSDDGQCGRYLWLSKHAGQCLHRVDEFLEDRSDPSQLLARLVRQRGIFCPWIIVAPAAEGFVSPVWCGAAFVVHAQPYRKGNAAPLRGGVLTIARTVSAAR